MKGVGAVDESNPEDNPAHVISFNFGVVCKPRMDELLLGRKLTMKTTATATNFIYMSINS